LAGFSHYVSKSKTAMKRGKHNEGNFNSQAETDKRRFQQQKPDKETSSFSSKQNEGFIYANTPMNMDDEEKNPDCC